jgi:hypothetical protein
MKNPERLFNVCACSGARRKHQAVGKNWALATVFLRLTNTNVSQ